MKYPPVNTLYVPAGLRASYPAGYRANGVIDSLGGGALYQDGPATIENARFVFFGASVLNSAIANTANFKAQIDTRFGTDVEIYDFCTPGDFTYDLAARIDADLASLPASSLPTYCIVHIGGNNVSASYPYSSTSQASRDAIVSDIQYCLNAISNAGFEPILAELSFRDYDDATVYNEDNGSRPFNENLIRPLVDPAWAYPDGSSMIQFYEVTRNKHEYYLSEDNIHTTPGGQAAWRIHIMDVVCERLFNGVTPTKIGDTLDDPPPPVVELLAEDHEEEGVPAGYTYVGSGAVDWNYSTAPAPLSGTRSLYIEGGQYSTPNYARKEFSASEVGTVGIYFQYAFITPFTSTGYVVQLMAEDESTVAMELRQNSSQQLAAGVGAVTLDTGATVLTQGQLYHVWIDFSRDIDKDECLVYLSTDGAKPEIPEITVSNLGGNTRGVKTIHWGASRNGDVIFDKERVATGYYGSNPT